MKNYGTTILDTLLFLLALWIMISLFLNDVSRSQRRKQVDDILPLMIQEIIDEKSKEDLKDSQHEFDKAVRLEENKFPLIEK